MKVTPEQAAEYARNAGVGFDKNAVKFQDFAVFTPQRLADIINTLLTAQDQTITDLLALIEAQRELMNKCVENNSHLADGENFSLIDIKNALNLKPGDVSLQEVGEVVDWPNDQAPKGVTFDNTLDAGTKLYALIRKNDGG